MAGSSQQHQRNPSDRETVPGDKSGERTVSARAGEKVAATSITHESMSQQTRTHIELPAAYEKLSELQQKAIVMLMTNATVRGAAVKLGVEPRQIYKWMRDPDFDAAYRESRWHALRLAIGGLARHSATAMNYLVHVVQEGEYEKNRVEASKLILDYAFRGIELEEVAARLAAVEQRQRDLIDVEAEGE